MTTMTLRAYAAHRKAKRLPGGSLASVQKAIATGRVVKESDGRIDAARADAAWIRNTHPLKSHAHGQVVTLDEQSAAELVVTEDRLSGKELITVLHDRGMANLTKLANAFGLKGTHLDAAPDILAAWLVASIGQGNIDALFGDGFPPLNREGQRMTFTAEEDREIDRLVNIAHRALGLEEIEIVKSKGKAKRK